MDNSQIAAVLVAPFVAYLIDLWDRKRPNKQARWPHRLGLFLGRCLSWQKAKRKRANQRGHRLPQLTAPRTHDGAGDQWRIQDAGAHVASGQPLEGQRKVERAADQ